MVPKICYVQALSKPPPLDAHWIHMSNVRTQLAPVCKGMVCVRGNDISSTPGIFDTSCWPLGPVINYVLSALFPAVLHGTRASADAHTQAI